MAIEIINDKSLWDGFIDASPQGMLFHKWDFLRIIEKYTGYSLRTYGIYKSKELIAIFPMFFKRTGGLKFAYSPPQGTLAYIPYMGPALSPALDGFDPSTKKECIASMTGDLILELKKYSPNFTSMILAPQMGDIRPFLWNGYDVEVMYTYLVDLRMPIEDVWNNLEGDFKKVIKRLDKNELSVKRANNVDALYSIMRDRLKNQGHTFFHRQSPEYLKELLAAFPDNLRMSVLYMDNEIIGAKLDCLYKDLYLGWSGGARVFSKISTNEFFEWETIKLAHSMGFKWYENWGGDMQRLNLFKSKLNPILVPRYHIRKMNTVGKLSEWGHDMVSNIPHLDFVKKLIA